MQIFCIYKRKMESKVNFKIIQFIKKDKRRIPEIRKREDKTAFR